MAAARALALTLALAGTQAVAQERFDHRGAVGLLLGGGLEFKEALAFSGQRAGGSRYGVELGGTWAVGHDGNELLAVGRAYFGGDGVDTALFAGYRGYFGQDRLKTFFDLGGAAHFTPAFVAGPRVGLGVQYELASTVGLYAGLAAQLGAGNGVRFSAEGIVGLQLRSYLLE